jgi:hypothetical protein
VGTEEKLFEKTGLIFADAMAVVEIWVHSLAAHTVVLLAGVVLVVEEAVENI